MRELTFQTLIPGCSAQDFYTIACSDATAITRFHHEANKDPSATVSDWAAQPAPGGGQQRVVEFTLAMAIPPSVQRFVGAEPIRIRETQTLVWLDDNTLRIVSSPELQISYARALTTQAELLIGGSAAGVSIDVNVKVTAGVPWPMQGTVEAIMADQAKKTVGQYVDYIGAYVEHALQQMNNEAEAPGAEAAPEAAAEQQQLAAVAAGKPPAAEAAAAVAQVQAPTTPAPSAPAVVTQQLALAPAASLAAAAEPPEVFYDALELAGPSNALEAALLRELQQAREARLEANRLLAGIRDSLQHVEQTLAREAAFQEGLRYGQRLSASSLLLSVAVGAAAASAATAFVLARRSAAK